MSAAPSLCRGTGIFGHSSRRFSCHEIALELSDDSLASAGVAVKAHHDDALLFQRPRTSHGRGCCSLSLEGRFDAAGRRGSSEPTSPLDVAQAEATEAKPAGATVHFIECLASSGAACAELAKSSVVALNLQGENLGRNGKLHFVQICREEDQSLFLFDIPALGAEAFGRGGLRALLEDASVTKYARVAVQRFRSRYPSGRPTC